MRTRQKWEFHHISIQNVCCRVKTKTVCRHVWYDLHDKIRRCHLLAICERGFLSDAMYVFTLPYLMIKMLTMMVVVAVSNSMCTVYTVRHIQYGIECAIFNHNWITCDLCASSSYPQKLVCNFIYSLLFDAFDT